MTSLAISITGLALDDMTTFLGLSRGFVETNPVYPYSLLIAPLFYVAYLELLEVVRR